MQFKYLLLSLAFFSQACGSEEYSGFSATYILSGTALPSDSGPVNLHYEVSTGILSVYDEPYETSADLKSNSEVVLSDNDRAKVNEALKNLGKDTPAKSYTDKIGAEETDGTKVTLILYTEHTQNRTVIIDTADTRKLPESLLCLYTVALRRGKL
jgi:hypothetical protein